MPTFETSQQFLKDMKALDAASLNRFRRVVLDQFVPDVDAGTFRKTLRVKLMKGSRPNRPVYEMAWGHDGRATFEYGEEIKDGVPHVVWRRLGTHSRLRTAPGPKSRFHG